jgi:ribonuclease D
MTHVSTVLREQVVERPEDLPACCEHLASCGRFGFDTEFVGEDTYHPHLCLVQVATPERLLLIDPLSVGPLDAFWRLVVDPRNEVVVHAGREEIRLCQLWSGRPPGNLFDLQLAAGLVGLPYPLGHGPLVSQLLRVQLAKGETRTEWRHRPLTASQIRYAFDDVRYLLPCRDRLVARLEQHDRLAWAAEEFQRLVASTSAEMAGAPSEPGVERWRKLKSLGSLDRRQLAVVRALFAWREERALQLNRPARAILRDDLLVEIARRGPTRERDLQIVRGLPRRDLDALVEVVRRCLALPIESCPPIVDRDFDPPQVGWLVNVLMAVLGNWCCRNQLASNLVATNAEIKQLVRNQLDPDRPPLDTPLGQGWRRDHVLPHLLAVLEGRVALRVADVRSAAPFEAFPTAAMATDVDSHGANRADVVTFE